MIKDYLICVAEKVSSILSQRFTYLWNLVIEALKPGFMSLILGFG